MDEEKYRVPSADEILAMDDLPVEIVPVPEWGPDVAVKVRGMSAEELLYYRLAEKLGWSRAAVGRLSSLEITGWIAYFQVMDWIQKSEKNDPDQALEFARSVQEIFEERATKRRDD
jgi:hypothetical protein